MTRLSSLAAAMFTLGVATAALASSHREAPFIAGMPRLEDGGLGRRVRSARRVRDCHRLESVGAAVG